MEEFWFKSTLFEVEPGEDEQTNPGLYGRQLSNWLRKKFIEIGYNVEEVIPEDWGWCVMCSRDPYMLWVGCRNLIDSENEHEDGSIETKEDMFWNCFVTAEVPIFKRLIKKVDTTPAVERLSAELKTILSSEPEIEFVDEP